MTDTGYANWLDRYRRAWIEKDADGASGLFTDDATYREQPFQVPHVGRQAIRHYWATVTAAQSEIELQYGQPAIEGRRVAVEWWANLLHHNAAVTLAGEFMLLFTEAGLCRDLREYWVMTDRRVDPPPGWGK